MRLFLSVLLSFTVTLSTIPISAQTTRMTPHPPTPAGVFSPAMMVECDSNQCEDQRMGGALWVFDGNRGYAVWRYTALGTLTITQNDGHHIVIERADPPGSPATKVMKVDAAGYFRGRYEGTITSKGIEGTVRWTNDPNFPIQKWHATFADSNTCRSGSTCPLTQDQMTELAYAAWRHNLPESSRRVATMLSGWGSADGLAMLALLDYSAAAGGCPDDTFMTARVTAKENSWVGMKLLSDAYQAGCGVKADAGASQQWAQSSKDQEEKMAEAIFLEQDSRDQAAAARARNGGGIDAGSMIVILGLIAAFSGDGEGGGSRGSGDFGNPGELLNKQRQGEYGGPGPAPPVVQPYVHD